MIMENEKQKEFEPLSDEDIKELLEMVTHATKDACSATAALYSAFADSLNSTQKLLQDSLKQISVSIAEAITNISFPQFTEKRKQKLLESYCQWGKLGWTRFQDAPADLYDSPPVDISDANAKVKHLCTMQGMESIFNQLREQKTNHEDLESAIFCFRNKQYKACALLLFGLIEAKMIKNQFNTERFVGKGAIRKLRAQFNEKKDEQILYTALSCENLLVCLDVLFAKTDGFKTEPEVINRNFINHGVNRRRVRKRDCIQLFLVLNNLIYFLSEDIVLSTS